MCTIFSFLINLKEIYIYETLEYILELCHILLANIYNLFKDVNNLTLAPPSIPNIKNIVNLTNLFNTHSNSLDVVPFSEYIEKDFVSILECYEFNKFNVDVYCTNALALDDARTDTMLDVRQNVNKTKHIKKAVRITIYTLNVLVADAIIPKYFSIVYFDSEMLFGELCFGKIASFSYGIGKSVSLGLNLVVV